MCDCVVVCDCVCVLGLASQPKHGLIKYRLASCGTSAIWLEHCKSEFGNENTSFGGFFPTPGNISETISPYKCHFTGLKSTKI